MLNVHELETRWLKYKIKSFIPHISILASLIVIFLIISQIDYNTTKTIKIENSSNSELINITEKNNTKEVINDTQELLTVNTSIKSHTTKKLAIKNPIVTNEDNAEGVKDKLLIAPSLGFMENMREESPAYYDSYIEPKTIKKQKSKIEKPAQKQNIIEKAQALKVEVPKIEDPKIEIPKVKTIVPVAVEKIQTQEIKIKRQNTQSDIQHVIKRFKTSNNPALSLFIAKKYYELGNYNQSYNYALITNELNNDVEESWIIFAKSLYKLNKKEKAITMLQKYISTSHSHQAKVLLDNIKNGKIQ